MKKCLLALSVAPLLLGCGDDYKPLFPAGSGVAEQTIRLESFADCASLEKHIEDTKVAESAEEVQRSFVALRAPWSRTGLQRGHSGMELADSSPPIARPKPKGSAKDEAAKPDIVKSTNNRIFTLVGTTLYAATSWPHARVVLGKIAIEGSPKEMFLDDARAGAGMDRVVVISDTSTHSYTQPAGPTWPAQAVPCPEGHYSEAALPGCSQNQVRVKITVVDASQLAALKVIAQTYLPGRYRTSRRANNLIHVVLGDRLSHPAAVRAVPEDPAQPLPDVAAYDAAVEKLGPANEAAIRGQTLADWLPEGEFKDANGQITKIPYRCQDFRFQNAPVHGGLTTIFTVDLSQSNVPVTKRTSVLGPADLIYASATSLYTATSHWWPEASFESEATYLHKFDLGGPGGPTYRGSGAVPGYVQDESSLDEHESYLRVATTVTTSTGPYSTDWPPPTSTRIYVFGNDAERLSVVGKTEEFAQGDRVSRAQFMGERAFIATFAYADPYLAFDLAKPAAPRKAGVLNVRAYTSYLHPVDEEHILAIDSENDATSPWTVAINLSLFDVKDLASPREIDKEVIGHFNPRPGATQASTWDEYRVTQDHRAFNYFSEHRLVVIPHMEHGPESHPWEGFETDLRVLRVDVNQGFLPRGILSMSDIYAGRDDSAWFHSSPLIERCFVATQFGQDFLFAISGEGIRAGELVDLGTNIETALFKDIPPPPLP